MNVWTSWKAATRYLLWSWIERISRAVTINKVAAREMAGLHPATLRELYDAGFACFIWEINNDGWLGFWRAADATPGMYYEAIYEVLQGDGWGSIPWHHVEFSGPEWQKEKREFRAVPKDYADKHLTRWTMKAAA